MARTFDAGTVDKKRSERMSSQSTEGTAKHEPRKVQRSKASRPSGLLFSRVTDDTPEALNFCGAKKSARPHLSRTFIYFFFFTGRLSAPLYSSKANRIA